MPIKCVHAHVGSCCLIQVNTELMMASSTFNGWVPSTLHEILLFLLCICVFLCAVILNSH